MGRKKGVAVKTIDIGPLESSDEDAGMKTSVSSAHLSNLPTPNPTPSPSQGMSLYNQIQAETGGMGGDERMSEAAQKRERETSASSSKRELRENEWDTVDHKKKKNSQAERAREALSARVRELRDRAGSVPVGFELLSANIKISYNVSVRQIFKKFEDQSLGYGIGPAEEDLAKLKATLDKEIKLAKSKPKSEVPRRDYNKGAPAPLWSERVKWAGPNAPSMEEVGLKEDGSALASPAVDDEPGPRTTQKPGGEGRTATPLVGLAASVGYGIAKLAQQKLNGKFAGFEVDLAAVAGTTVHAKVPPGREATVDGFQYTEHVLNPRSIYLLCQPQNTTGYGGDEEVLEQVEELFVSGQLEHAVIVRQGARGGDIMDPSSFTKVSGQVQGLKSAWHKFVQRRLVGAYHIRSRQQLFTTDQYTKKRVPTKYPVPISVYIFDRDAKAENAEHLYMHLNSDNRLVCTPDDSDIASQSQITITGFRLEVSRLSDKLKEVGVGHYFLNSAHGDLQIRVDGSDANRAAQIATFFQVSVCKTIELRMCDGEEIFQVLVKDGNVDRQAKALGIKKWIPAGVNRIFFIVEQCKAEDINAKWRAKNALVWTISGEMVRERLPIPTIVIACIPVGVTAEVIGDMAKYPNLSRKSTATANGSKWTYDLEVFCVLTELQDLETKLKALHKDIELRIVREGMVGVGESYSGEEPWDW
jgi:hypothetical protein